jgi:cytochrome c oxidase subunit 3
MAHGQEHHFAHHFESAEHEFEASKEGMWLFLVTEVLMIGGLFVGYLLFRGMYLEDFKVAHKLLSVPLGATNTVVLLLSSLTMALAVTSSQLGDRKKTAMYLLFTILCGAAFCVVKYFEYSHKLHEGTLPAGFFTAKHALDVVKYPHAPVFFSFYFAMTGIHALHVVIGMGLMTWLLLRNQRGEFSAAFFTPVELVGFYWHFVDLVWIYLFPLLYLVG